MKLSLVPYRLPMKAPWPGSRQFHRRGWLIRLRKGTQSGWGDCAPMPEMGTEGFSQAEDILSQWQTKVPIDIADILDMAIRERQAFPASSHALETAALDLLGQQSHLPLRQLLSPSASENIRVNSMAGSVCKAGVKESLQQGYRVIKLKMGRQPIADEMDCLRHLCRQLPSPVRLRLDANGAWSFDDARRLMTELQGLPVESLEEPLAEADLAGLERLQEESPLTLALDESLARLPFDEILDSSLPRLVFKPMVLGGARHCMDLAGRATKAGKQCLTTSTLESALGLRAACHLAAAMDGLSPGLAHGLATSDWLLRDIARPPSIEAGCIHLSSRPGLGIDDNFQPPFQDSFS